MGHVGRDPIKFTLSLVIAGACLVLTIDWLVPIVIIGNLTPDFTMLWTAGRFALDSGPIYDIDALTAAQETLRRPPGPLPFPYPPTALPLVAPFALLPFWTAYFLWVALSALLFWSAARQLASGWALVLTFLAPHVVILMTHGQTSLIVGTAVLWGIMLLPSRPLVGGFLLGLAIAVKPQSALLAPIALASGRHWSGMAGMAAGSCVAVILSLPFGLARWWEWYQALDEFQQIVTDYGIDSFGTSPAMAARALGLQNVLPVQIVGSIVGIVMVWRGFRSEVTASRVVSFVCGGALAAPYAICYELALLAPVATTAIFSNSLRGLLIGSPLVAVNAFIAVPATLVSGFMSKRFPAPFPYGKSAAVQVSDDGAPTR